MNITPRAFLQTAELESAEGNKAAPRSGFPRRTRAAEVHNLSERVGYRPFLIYQSFFYYELHVKSLVLVQRRRERINEKMKALQELIPHCNKVTDNDWNILSQLG